MNHTEYPLAVANNHLTDHTPNLPAQRSLSLPAPIQQSNAASASPLLPVAQSSYGTSSYSVPAVRAFNLCQCPTCGADNHDNSALCYACGTQLLSQPKRIRCRSCHNHSPNNLMLCPHCGRELRPSASRLIVWGGPIALLTLFFIFLSVRMDNTDPLRWIQSQAQAGVEMIQEMSEQMDPVVSIGITPIASLNQLTDDVVSITDGTVVAKAMTIEQNNQAIAQQQGQTVALNDSAEGGITANDGIAPSNVGVAASAADGVVAVITTGGSEQPEAVAVVPNIVDEAVVENAQPQSVALANTAANAVSANNVAPPAAAPAADNPPVADPPASTPPQPTPVPVVALPTAPPAPPAEEPVVLVPTDTPLPPAPTVPAPTATPLPPAPTATPLPPAPTAPPTPTWTPVPAQPAVAQQPSIEQPVVAQQVVAASAPSSSSHIVQSGDTPSNIAARYAVPVEALMATNNLSRVDANNLQIGQVLVIPSGNPAISPPASSPASPPVNNDTVMAASNTNTSNTSDVASVADEYIFGAPNLSSPGNGVTIECDNDHQLSWQPVGGIQSSHAYVVHIGFVDGIDENNEASVVWLFQQKLKGDYTTGVLDADFCGLSSDEMGNQWRWYVEVVQDRNGETIPISPPSTTWGFVWR
ncbi:MAG: LysM peptidoglycan-binding domain-containing protein [Chloroflexota bacterium]